MIKKLSFFMFGIVLIGSAVNAAYEIISSLPISTTNINENILSGAEIADLSTVGGEGPYDYYLTVSGAGIDNDKFYISGSKLYLNFTPDYENPIDSGIDNKYTIELKTLDSSKPIKYAKDFGRWFQSEGGFYGDSTVGSNYFIQGIMNDGSVYYAGPDYTNYLLAPEETGFVNLITNWYATAGLKEDGAITTRGKIGSGGTGGPIRSGYVSISSSPVAFAALHQDGSIDAWGTYERGGIGAPAVGIYTKVISNNSGFTALRDDGSVYSRGSIYTGNMPADTGFVDIFANGGGAFAALKSDGSIKAWGRTGYGGTGAPTSTGFVKIAGNAYAFAALKSDGSIVSWGDAVRGGTSPVGTGYTKIYGGGQAFAALKSDGSIKAWGHTSYGGSGAPTGTGYVNIHAGNRSFSAIKDNGSIASWGYGLYGGTGAPTRAGFVDMVGNYYIMLALHGDGSLFSWGDPAYGGGTVPTGTGFIKIFAFSNSMAAVKNDGSIIYRGGSTTNDNVYRMGASYKTTYDISVLDQDEVAPIGTVTYIEATQKVTATLHLNESGIVVNNGGAFDYIFTQTGSFTFEFADLAGNTGSVVATVTTIPSNGGGVRLVKDNCPDGDNSPSYYDHLCGVPVVVSPSEGSGSKENPIIKEPIIKVVEPTWQEVYQWAKTNELTTMPDYVSARLGDPITRGELAKVMVNYFKDKQLDSTNVCEFSDIGLQTEEIQSYIKKSCQMGIMGIDVDYFNPDTYVSRAELSTIISRALWGNTYENKSGLYYQKHIEALNQKGIIKDKNPYLQEARGYVLLMLMRI